MAHRSSSCELRKKRTERGSGSPVVFVREDGGGREEGVEKEGEWLTGRLRGRTRRRRRRRRQRSTTRLLLLDSSRNFS